VNNPNTDPVDKKLHITVSTSSSNPLDERTAFNDVIEHGDIVQGFQSPKSINQIPKWYQKPLKIFTVITLLVFASVLIYQIIDIITLITAGK
jgi:hypothetical protein